MSIDTLTGAILRQMPDMGKWQQIFMKHILRMALSFRGRLNFTNLSRQGGRHEATYRNNFSRPFDWLAFNTELVKRYTLLERIVVFDPSYLSKSGRFTPGVGWYWSGCAGAAKWGLEIGAFSVVDIVNHASLHLEAAQTLHYSIKEGASLLEAYGDMVVDRAEKLLETSGFLCCDAYFSRKPFVDKVLQAGMHLVTRLRKGTVLRYPYLGPQKAGKGRKKQFSGRVDVLALDPQYFTPCAVNDEGEQAFEAMVYVNAWKRWAKVTIVHQYDPQGKAKAARMYACTLATIPGADVWLYYKARFQSEFLYRDAKQHTGLEHCQSRKEEALDFHFNASLSAVSLAKALHWLAKPAAERGPFSMADIKTQYTNELMLDLFFSTCGIDPHITKNNPKYEKLYNFGRFAA
jgi:Transposase DDE domain